jgi:hypothetical protein
LVYEAGQFDKWRVTFYYADGRRTSPTDVDFFRYFLSLQDNKAVWQVIREIGNQIDRTTEFGDVEIHTLRGTEEEEKWFSAYAAALISEERKAKTRLGKKIKLVGACQALCENMDVQEAANWSKGREWRQVDQEYQRCMRLYGEA